MKIATWNINGIRARLDGATTWLRDAQPDILCMQEIKSEDRSFPGEAFEDLGYNVAVHGQKGFNGVAVLSRLPIDETAVGLPGDDADAQARFLEVVVSVEGAALRVGSLYLPNGNPVGTEKFAYKLAWMERLIARARELLEQEETFVYGGDYNVCPEDRDCYDPVGFANDALCRPESRSRFRQLVYLGLTEAYRALHPDLVSYSYWDYTGGAWQKDHGLRIDHLLLSPQAADRLTACDIDRTPRGKERPSDHTPVWCELADV